jgi:hypothetical protein
VLACVIVLSLDLHSVLALVHGSSLSLVHFSFFFGSREGKLTVKGVFVGKEAATGKAKGERGR